MEIYVWNQCDRKVGSLILELEQKAAASPSPVPLRVPRPDRRPTGNEKVETKEDNKQWYVYCYKYTAKEDSKQLHISYEYNFVRRLAQGRMVAPNTRHVVLGPPVVALSASLHGSTCIPFVSKTRTTEDKEIFTPPLSSRQQGSCNPYALVARATEEKEASWCRVLMRRLRPWRPCLARR